MLLPTGTYQDEDKPVLFSQQILNLHVHQSSQWGARRVGGGFISVRLNLSLNL